MRLIKAPEAARIVGVSSQAVYKAIKVGHLAYYTSSEVPESLHLLSEEAVLQWSQREPSKHGSRQQK